MKRYDKLNGVEYFPDVFVRPEIVVQRVARAIRTYFPNCGGVASADGLSGATIVVPVAMELGLPFCIARLKKGSHSGRSIASHLNCSDVVFIDDFVCSGYTLWKSRNILKSNKIPIIGAVFYGDYNKQYTKIDKYHYQWDSGGVVDVPDNMYKWPHLSKDIIPCMLYKRSRRTGEDSKPNRPRKRR